MKIPKTPIAFDYDLWTTEDGKCMVRVKRTGEVSEVDRKVMRILRAEEKRIRRSYGSDNTSEDEDGAEKISDIIIHMIAQPEGKAQCTKSRFTDLAAAASPNRRKYFRQIAGLS